MKKYRVLIDWKGEAENVADARKQAANASADVRVGEITLDEIEHFADAFFPGKTVVVFGDMEEAFIGLTHDGRAVYDYEKMVQSKMENDGMTFEEAREFIDYNTMTSLKYYKNAPLVLYPYV